MSKESLIEQFKKELIKVDGEFYIYKDIKDVVNKVNDIIIKEGIRRIVINKKINIARAIFNELKKNSGIIIESTDEIDKKNTIIKEKFKSVDLGISCADYLVADTGSVILINNEDEPRLLSLLPEFHIVLSTPDQLIEKLEDAVDLIANKDWVTVITGPSRTADIEKVLVTGVHGPRKLYVFMFDI